MRISIAWALSCLVTIATQAAAATPGELARAHVAAVAAGDIAAVTAHYATDAALQWVGGPLNGAYAGAAQLQALWRKFKAQTPMQVELLDVREFRNPAGSTVTANLVFSNVATSGQTTIRMHYVMLCRAGLLVNEIWQIEPKLAY